MKRTPTRQETFDWYSYLAVGEPAPAMTCVKHPNRLRWQRSLRWIFTRR